MLLSLWTQASGAQLCPGTRLEWHSIWPERGTKRRIAPPPSSLANMSGRETTSNELAAPEPDPCIRTFKEHMHLELEPPKLSGKRTTSPKLSPRSSPRLFRKLMVNKGMRQRRRFTVAHTW